MKVTYYYVRHGETLFNLLGRLQGQCDAPLTEKGIAQAENTASALRKVPFSAIYSSTSERAMNTAEIMAAPHHLEVNGLKQLKEFSFGRLDGGYYSDNRRELLAHNHTDDWHDVGGEDLNDFSKRLKEAFAIMNADARDGDTVLIVSHGAFFGHLVQVLFHDESYIARISEDRNAKLLAIGNCEIARFTFEDGVFKDFIRPCSADAFRNEHHKHVQFYYVRHGETIFNQQSICQGRCDSPLSERGIEQVKATAEALKDVPFTKAYSSTAERALDTSEIILQYHHLKARREKRLREVFFGTYDGIYFEPLHNVYDLIHKTEDWSPYGGESPDEISKRIHDVLRDIADEAEDGDVILLTAHALLYRCILRFFFREYGKTYHGPLTSHGQADAPNAGIFPFIYDDGTFSKQSYMIDSETFRKEYVK